VTPLRVLLGEDHAVVREGTRQILEAVPDLDVVGEAADGQQVVDLAARLKPDIVLLDLGLPVFNGIEATRRIVAAANPPRVLILSAFDDADYVVAAIEAGASGYLLKSAHGTEVIAAIRAVANGQVVLHPSIARHIVGGRARAGGAREDLSPRELEVLRLAARGGRTRDIAASLAVSARTIESTFTNIFNKLGVASRTEAIVYAAARGWITLQAEPGLDER
jgi:DNA-binding NarL/FixJ family response regulator